MEDSWMQREQLPWELSWDWAKSWSAAGSGGGWEWPNNRVATARLFNFHYSLSPGWRSHWIDNDTLKVAPHQSTSTSTLDLNTTRTGQSTTGGRWWPTRQCTVVAVANSFWVFLFELKILLLHHHQLQWSQRTGETRENARLPNWRRWRCNTNKLYLSRFTFIPRKERIPRDCHETKRWTTGRLVRIRL